MSPATGDFGLLCRPLHYPFPRVMCEFIHSRARGEAVAGKPFAAKTDALQSSNASVRLKPFFDIIAQFSFASFLKF